MFDVVQRRQAAGEIEGRDIGADRADIGAEVAGVANAQRQKASLLVERQFGFGINVTRLVIAQERFGAARHPVDRTAKLLGAHHLRDVFRVRAGLQAERTADVVGEDPQPLLRNLHDRGDRIAHGGSALRADAQRVEVGGRIVARGRAARLHRSDDHSLVHHRNARDKFRGSEDFVDFSRIRFRIGGRPRPVDRKVARRLRPHLRRAGSQCLARVDHRCERFVFDGDELGGILRGGSAVGDHHRHRLADMHHPFGRERRSMRHDQCLAATPVERRMAPEAADPFHIIRRQHAQNAARAQRGDSVHADDAGKGVR